MIFSGADGRLRAGWRIALFLLLTMALSITAMLSLRAIFGRLPRTLAPLVVAPVATFTVFACRRFLDRKTFVSLGLQWNRRALFDTIFGFLLSGFLVAGIFFLEFLTGWIRMRGPLLENGSASTAFTTLLLGLLTTGIVVAFWEELVFRGYLLQNMSDGLGLSWAVAISVVLYGVLHMANPGASALSGTLIALIGILRIYGWLSTRQLWLSIGMHAGWNFFQGPVFGFGVSGHQTSSLIHHEITGPTWLTGGDFGPEAGLVSLPAILVGLGFMYCWTRGRRE